MDILRRSNVSITGSGSRPIVFAHGFGCDQKMWRFVAPSFDDTHRVVLFDHAGCGGADPRAFDLHRHATLGGYADDVADLLRAADLRDVVYVGHSVSAMIGVLAEQREPGRIAAHVMIGPSPRYLNDPPDYRGGFERADIEGLIDMIESNLFGWARFLAPIVMGPAAGAEMTGELEASFCSGDPAMTRRFAEATFLGDNRSDLPGVRAPSLVIQMRDDAIASLDVGEYVCRSLPKARMAVIEGSGHCAHMTHPERTTELIREFLAAG